MDLSDPAFPVLKIHFASIKLLSVSVENLLSFLMGYGYLFSARVVPCRTAVAKFQRDF